MMGRRLPRGLGWLSVGLGLTELAFAEGICRRLGVRGRASLVRAMGARELVTGLGLLSQPKPSPWLWGRVVGDAIDLSLLGTTVGRSAGSSIWKITSIVAVMGITLVDVYAASGPRTRSIPEPSTRDMTELGGPGESWRGSGLAEDVGAPPSGTAPEEDEAERQQRMREAERQLGLPSVESLDTRS